MWDLYQKELISEKVDIWVRVLLLIEGSLSDCSGFFGETFGLMVAL